MERSDRGNADGSRKRWWQVAVVVGALLVAAVAVSSQLGLNRDSDSAESAEPDPEPRADELSPEGTTAPVTTLVDAGALADSGPPALDDQPTDPDNGTGSDYESGTELSEAFGEPEHPVSGVEPYIGGPVLSDESGLPADVCRGVLPAQRVQLALRFASTKPEGVDQLSWSPDCRRMVFRVGSTLWVADGDGTSDMPFLTAQHGLSSPAWSPDSEWIAFSQGAIVGSERASHIYIVRPNGLGLARLGHSGVVLDREPAWSPDGTRIAFSRREWVSDGSNPARAQQHLVIVEIVADPDRVGTGVRPSEAAALTGRQWVLAVGGESGSWPVWSPDGESIAYRSGDRLVLLRLADLSQSVLLDSAVGGRGSWSPDGSAIAAMSEWSNGRATIAVRSLRGSPTPNTIEEYVIAVDGAMHTATSGPPALRWSETGNHLLFHATDPRGTHWIYRLAVPRADASRVTGRRYGRAGERGDSES